MSGRSDLPMQEGRHHLVWLTQHGWLDAVAKASAEQRHHLQHWQAHDWPAVIRRRDVDAQTDEVCLGVALPPDAEGGKLRIALRIGRAGVREVQSPLSVAAVVSHAPTPWQGALRNLHDDVAAGGLSVRVYGSLALQVLTGQVYLRPTSDIDLLFAPVDCAGLQQGMQLLQTHASVLPLDGEVIFPDGVAVAWKEWALSGGRADNRVLVKRHDDVALMRVGDLLAALEENPCPA